MTKDKIPAFEGKAPYIFVSYAHKNSEEVIPIIESLYKDKYRVWYDEGIAPGSEWPKNIEDHLKAAKVVLVFVSNESLLSLNCENEVANSKPEKRKVLQYSLDGSVHIKLKDCATVKCYEDLKKHLDIELIGDGKTGYQLDLIKSKKGNYWTGLIVFSIILLLLLITSLYGLNEGWFNNFLPELNSSETIEDKNQNVIVTSNNVLAHAIVSSTNQELVKTINFNLEETKEYLYEALSIDMNESINYQDLISNDTEEIVFEKANDELLEYMQYFSNLKCIAILNGNISTLEPLTNCAYLKTVKIKGDLLPVIIPEDKLFEVEYIGN